MSDHREPAFPQHDLGGETSWPGMTLRDWFAGHALAGLIQGYSTAYGSPTSAPDEVVVEAYGYADAMLRAREGKQ